MKVYGDPLAVQMFDLPNDDSSLFTLADQTNLYEL